ncbi:MAG: helix-turn-helix transcriptional regulator [Cryobacterium sp.]|nr:helix-turn-helix transcriptional regulator [Cryobacterium sp.]MBX3089043.1 helix-turn-helix transcriptional regulator [Cryobacterium sp.]MBX3117159.1 helix-turn-helix transcriptional regulator [Cryobacterium sp.]MCO5294278.1 helix-turn-helix domain-containing protein [Homoserinimonas sp.]MCW5944343.1 helix-turn-helix transcriptional regulator [Cryobacterium sp.]
MSNNEDLESMETRPVRTIDLESLKALAHPLRVKIFDVLSTYGEFTASGLAERLGESSGATSYHLRQLEKHGFVREVEGKGVGRERWWERVPGAVNLGLDVAAESAAGKEATQLVMKEWSNNRERTLADFLDKGEGSLSKDWIEASMISVTNVFVTNRELAEFAEKIAKLAAKFAEKHRNQRTEGSRPVQIQINAFPVVDGEEITTQKREEEK